MPKVKVGELDRVGYVIFQNNFAIYNMRTYLCPHHFGRHRSVRYIYTPRLFVTDDQ